jgi:sugar phosphate permease
VSDLSSLFTSIRDLITAAFPALGAASGAIGTFAFVIGKMGNSPPMMQWGKNGWIGAIIAFCATGIALFLEAIGTALNG